MNRLVYYLIVVNMIASISTIVPRILLAKSKDGAIISMGFGLVAGLIITYIIILFFNKYPGKGLPELMKINTPKWLYGPVLLYFGIMWYIAGLITLITYTFILIIFLTPEMSLFLMTIPFLLIISYGVLMKSENLLYTMEIVLILFLPIGLLTFVKAYSSEQFNWDFVKIAIMNANDYPDLSVFTASLFTFMGVFNIVVFNRYFFKKQSFGKKQLAVIGIIGISILFTTYFMPIGFGGFEYIERLLYPWVSTTDSVRMRFGIIERLVFIFMLFFVSISFISIVIHWHVSAQFLNSIIHFKKLKWKNKNYTLQLFALFFSITALIITQKINATDLYLYTKYFYNTLPLFVVIFLISIFAVNRGAKS